MAAQKGQRGGVSAVVNPAGKALGLQEGDVFRVRHHQLAVGLARRHNDFGEGRFGLVRRGDADAPRPQDRRGVMSQPLEGAAALVRADVSHPADRHPGQRGPQRRIRQLHHREGAALPGKAGAGRRQLGRGPGQRFKAEAGEVLRRPAERRLIRRGAVNPDPPGQRPPPRVVTAGFEPGRPEHPAQQDGHSGLARRARDSHILQVRGLRQERAQAFRRDKALGTGCKIFVCLLDGHDLFLIFCVSEIPRRHGPAPAAQGPQRFRPEPPQNPARRRSAGRSVPGKTAGWSRRPARSAARPERAS